MKVINLTHDVDSLMRKEVMETEGEGDAIHPPPAAYKKIVEIIQRTINEMAAQGPTQNQPTKKRSASSPPRETPGGKRHSSEETSPPTTRPETGPGWHRQQHPPPGRGGGEHGGHRYRDRAYDDNQPRGRGNRGNPYYSSPRGRGTFVGRWSRYQVQRNSCKVELYSSFYIVPFSFFLKIN